MSKKANELMGIVDGFINSIQQYDGHFNMSSQTKENCVMSGYRDSAFGILLSLLTLDHITSGDFHRKLHKLNTEFYRKIN